MRIKPGHLKYILAIMIISYGYNHFKYSSRIDHSGVHNAQTKANLFNIQVILEKYATDYQEYPENIDILKNYAIREGYWKKLMNPYIEREVVLLDLEKAGTLPEFPEPGTITYFRSLNNSNSTYTLCAINQKREFFEEHHKKFCLSGKQIREK